MPAGRVIFLLFAVLCAVGLPVQAKVFPVEVSGGDDELRKNIIAHVGDVEMDDASQLARLKPALDKSIRKAAEALGYYQADWKVRIGRAGVSLKEAEALPGEQVVRIDITPGEPVLFRNIEVRVTGEGGTLEAVRKLSADPPIRKGGRLRHWEYDSLKTELLRTLLAAGYLDATYETSMLRINKSARWADVVLVANSGDRYYFGQLSYSGTSLRPGLLDRLVLFPPGRPFSQEAFKRIRSRLIQSGYFSTVEMHTTRRIDHGTRYIDLALRLTDQKSHFVDVGAGFSTDSGAKVSLGWRWPRMNDYGHTLRTTSEFSFPSQTLDFSYRVPLGRPLVESVNFHLSLEHTALDNTDSMVSTLGVFYQNLRKNNWQLTYGSDIEMERYSEGASPSRQVLYVVPLARWNRTELAEGQDPDQGYQVDLSVEGSHPALGSDTSFFKGQVSLQGLTHLTSADWLLLGRMTLGAIATSNMGEVPVSRRFFTGGDKTVRGFEYGSISPRNSDGDLVGGQYLNVFSVESNYRVAENWRLGVFYDFGRAFTDFSFPFYSSVGPGLRWLSPFGQIRFDLAFPLQGAEASNPRLHVSFGRAL